MHNSSSIFGRVAHFLKEHFLGIGIFAILTGVAGDFLYDQLRGSGNFSTYAPPARPPLPDDPRGGPNSTKPEGQGREDPAAQRRARLAELLSADVYPVSVTLIAVRAERETSQTSQVAARDAADILVRQLGRDGRRTVEVPSAFVKSPYFEEVMNGSVQSIKEAGIDKKLRMAIFATVGASCATATSVPGVTSCTVDIRMYAVDSKLQIVLSERWAGTGAGANERDAIVRSVERVFEGHAEQINRL